MNPKYARPVQVSVYKRASIISRKKVNVAVEMSTHRKRVSSHSACPLGPAYDLTFTEVRDDSVVVEWQKPVYSGSGPITGYHVEYAKKGTSEWTTANQTAVSHRFHKVRTSLTWCIFQYDYSSEFLPFIIWIQCNLT